MKRKLQKFLEQPKHKKYIFNRLGHHLFKEEHYTKIEEGDDKFARSMLTDIQVYVKNYLGRKHTPSFTYKYDATENIECWRIFPENQDAKDILNLYRYETEACWGPMESPIFV